MFDSSIHYKHVHVRLIFHLFSSFSSMMVIESCQSILRALFLIEQFSRALLFISPNFARSDKSVLKFDYIRDILMISLSYHDISKLS